MGYLKLLRDLRDFTYYTLGTTNINLVQTISFGILYNICLSVASCLQMMCKYSMRRLSSSYSIVINNLINDQLLFSFLRVLKNKAFRDMYIIHHFIITIIEVGVYVNIKLKFSLLMLLLLWLFLLIKSFVLRKIFFLAKWKDQLIYP